MKLNEIKLKSIRDQVVLAAVEKIGLVRLLDPTQNYHCFEEEGVRLSVWNVSVKDLPGLRFDLIKPGITVQFEISIIALKKIYNL